MTSSKAPFKEPTTSRVNTISNTVLSRYNPNPRGSTKNQSRAVQSSKGRSKGTWVGCKYYLSISGKNLKIKTKIRSLIIQINDKLSRKTPINHIFTSPITFFFFFF